MKKISKLLLLFAALIFCCSTFKASAEDYHSVYWFSVSIKIDEHQEIKILDSATNVIQGTIKDFSKAVKQGIAQNQIVVGPFHTEREAKNARIYYKKSKNEIGELPQPNKPNELNWFECAVEKRKDSYIFTRTPAAVSSGSAAQLTKDLYEALIFRRFVIGPFEDYVHAEEAKAVYRQFDKVLKNF